MNDPLVDLTVSLTQFNPFQGESLGQVALKAVIDNRIILDAHPDKATSAAETLKTFIQGQGYDASEVKMLRVQALLGSLFKKENITLENSRVLASIINQLIKKLGTCSIWLRFYCSAKIVHQGALQSFQLLWSCAPKRAIELGQTDLPVGLADLRRMTIFVADLHAEGAINKLDFTYLINGILPLIQGPKLFDLFLYSFLARGLTGSGKKLEPDTWRRVEEKWNSLKAVYTLNDLPGTVIDLFSNDTASRQDGEYCGFPWEIQLSSVATQLCEDIISGDVIREAMREDEEDMLVEPPPLSQMW